MLSLQKPLTLKIPAPSGVKTLTFNFPSDDQIDRRQKARSFSVKGSPEVTTVNECPKLDVEIVNEIRIEGDDLDPTEATLLLNRLHSIEITDGGRCEAGFYVEFKFLGQETRHEVSVPSADELQKFRRAYLTSTSTRYAGTTHTTHLKPGRDLYDKLVVKSEGYPEGYVPIHHKAMVMQELIPLIEGEVLIENPTPSPTTQP